MKKILLLIFLLTVSCENIKEKKMPNVKFKAITEIFKKENAPEISNKNQEQDQDQEESFSEKIIWTIVSGTLGIIILFKLKKSKFI